MHEFIRKTILATVLTAALMTWSMVAQATAREEFDGADDIYMAAGACLAAYSDRPGKLAYDYLENDGWKIKPYIMQGEKADARFLLAEKNDDGHELYVLAVTGTANTKDIKTDLRVDKVYFAGHNVDEFAANAEKKDVPETEPKVHRGFHQYVQAALAATTIESDGSTPELLSSLLMQHPDRKVYLTGHSLGGAAAIIGGARLLDMGIKPEQIEIITFGSPAVGNKAFADKFAAQLNVTRVVISGDPVTGVLQKLVGGYCQFGREVKWETPEYSQANPHNITGYLDMAMKNYYDKQSAAQSAGELEPSPVDSGNDNRVYVAQLACRLPEELQVDFKYMSAALLDEYRSLLPAYHFGQATQDVLAAAAAADCQWAVVPEVSAYRLRDTAGTYYVTLQQVVYDVQKRTIIRIVANSTSTKNVTPIEAIIHDVRSESLPVGREN